MPLDDTPMHILDAVFFHVRARPVVGVAGMVVVIAVHTEFRDVAGELSQRVQVEECEVAGADQDVGRGVEIAKGGVMPIRVM
jgi:CRISPR/Cas system-associated protein Cas7 (RAMP superfamily)